MPSGKRNLTRCRRIAYPEALRRPAPRLGSVMGPGIPELRLGGRLDDFGGMVEQPLIELGADGGVGSAGGRSRPEVRGQPGEQGRVRVLASGQVT